MQRGVLALPILLAILPAVALGQDPVGVRSGSPTGVFTAPDGAPLAYEVTGEGPPLVLIHGWSLNRRMWADQVPALARRYRVVTYDRRGFGDSGGREDASHDPADLRDLLRHLGIERAHVLGMSQGAWVAMSLALGNPGMVRSLVLHGSPPPAGFGLPWTGPDRPLPRQATRELIETEGLAAFRRVWAEHPLLAIPASRPGVRRRLETILSDYDGGYFTDSAEPGGDAPRPTMERLAEIAAPTLVLTGDEEVPYLQAVAAALSYGLPAARRVVVPGGGHMVNMVEPAAYNAAVLGFLRPLDAGPEVRSTTSPDGVEIVFESWGEENERPALVFVHGWSNNRSYWTPHLAALAGSHQVVALDLAGFGESGVGRPRWTMHAFGGDVAAVVRALDLEEVVLVGFSMGAGAVLEAALQAPDRVIGVVLVDWLQDPTTRYPEPWIRDLVAQFDEAWRDPAWVRQNGFTEATPDSLVRAYIASVPPVPPQHWTEALVETFRWADRRLVPVLESVRVPVAAINSDRVATNVAAYRRYVPSFDVRIMPGLGHLGVIWEETERFDRHLLALVRKMEVHAEVARALDEHGAAMAEQWPLLRPSEVDFHTEEVHELGDMAVSVGTYRFAFEPGDQPRLEDHGRFMLLWKRGPDGRWRIHRDITNSAVPPGAHE